MFRRRRFVALGFLLLLVTLVSLFAVFVVLGLFLVVLGIIIRIRIMMIVVIVLRRSVTAVRFVLAGWQLAWQAVV